MTEQTESESLESLWQTSELRRAQDSIDRVSPNGSDSGDLLYESFHKLVGGQSASDSCQPIDRHQEIAKWAATLTGVTLNRYLIEAMLGHGGFGVVFRAFDSELNRHVAIKIPRPDVFATRDTRERFLNEARVVAALRHPGIVQVLDVVSMGPLLLIASELSTGVTLQDWIRSQTSPIKPRIAARIVMELAETIGFAHSRGVIHQDLKPANILMEWSDGNTRDAFPDSIRVTDFGLACRFSENGIHAGATPGGTRHYMAPEQTGDSSQIGAHSDVYALGLILGELLCGVPVATRCRELTDRPDDTAPSSQILLPVQLSCPRGVSAELWAVYRCCVAVDVRSRYRDGWSLRDDLRDYLAYRPVKARPLTLARITKSWCYQKPFAATLVGLLVLSITLGLTGTLVGLRRSRTALRELSHAYGSLSRRSGNWKHSVGHLRAAIASQPNQLDVELEYVDTLVSLQRYSEANQVLARLRLHLTPEFSSRFLLLEGELALAANRPWKEVEQLFQRALAASPPASIESHFARAMCSATTLDAVASLRQAIKVAPHHHLSHVKLLAGLFFLGQYEEAQRECASIELLFPEDWTPQAYSAFICVARGDRKQADSHLAEIRSRFGRDELIGFEQELSSFEMLAKLAANEEEWTVAQRLLDTVRLAAVGVRAGDQHSQPDVVSIGFRRPILPTVSRAWQHLQEAVKHLMHETLPTACQELEQATRLHPEATLYQVHAAACVELNFSNPQELLAKTVAATESLQAATERTGMFPSMQPAARRMAVLGQYILGRPTRRVGPPDPEMARLALLNIRTTLREDPEVETAYLKLFAGYAETLGDSELAHQVALDCQSRDSNDQAIAIFLAQQEVTLGRHQEALTRLRSVEWDTQYADQSALLSEACKKALAAMLDKGKVE